MKGKPFILYFYPKADTPGCTKEACAFQEATPRLEEIGLDVIGVSPDKIKPIEKFAAKYGLTFPLASDEDHAVAERYGTWVEKSMYGRKYMGMERSTFLIGADGKVLKDVAQGQRDRPCGRRDEGGACPEAVIKAVNQPVDHVGHEKSALAATILVKLSKRPWPTSCATASEDNAVGARSPCSARFANNMSSGIPEKRVGKCIPPEASSTLTRPFSPASKAPQDVDVAQHIECASVGCDVQIAFAHECSDHLLLQHRLTQG